MVQAKMHNPEVVRCELRLVVCCPLRPLAATPGCRVSPRQAIGLQFSTTTFFFMQIGGWAKGEIPAKKLKPNLKPK
jgi:hypothetical protein